MNPIQAQEKTSFDVRSVMDILYGEESRSTDGAFICADDGKQKALKAEVIQLPEEEKNYSSFWRK